MKYLIIIVFASFSLLAQDFNKLDSDGKKHGLWKGFYEESKRQRYEGTFDHGKEIGLFKFFDDTKVGTVIATRDFSKTDNSCYTIFYNQKKNKVSEGKVVNKLFEGEWKYYYEDSSIVMTIELYTQGKLNGIRKVYYKSGKIAEETTYKNGIKNGIYKKYTEEGILLEESIYKNGEYDGLAIYKTPENQVAGQGLFKNGKKVGVWKILEKGKLIDINMNLQGKKFQKRVKPLEE